MDFKNMSDHELLLVINLKSEIKYSHEELQEARKVYIDRIFGSASSPASSCSASKTEEQPPVQQPEERKISAPITAFDLISDSEQPVIPTPSAPVYEPEKPEASVTDATILIPPLPIEKEEEITVSAFSDEAAMEGHTTLFRPITDEMLAQEIDTQAEESASETTEEVKEEETKPPLSYTYMPIDDTPYTPASYKKRVKRESSISRFFHSLLAYLIMPLIMIHELCVFTSSVVLLVSNFKSIFYHVCTLTDFAYMVLILFVWYFILNRRTPALCRIFVYTEIFRTLFNLSLQSTFGVIISIAYIILLVLTSFTIKNQD